MEKSNFTLEIKELGVSIGNKEILRGVNMGLERGKVYALQGSNGSGKSTLAQTLMGNPKYTITKGDIFLNEKNITGLNSNERAKRGIFLSFQNPTEVPGVIVSNFLRQSYNSIHEKKLSVLEFRKLLEQKCDELDIDKKFLSRYLNEGFSGGEKKKMEVLQMLVLNPTIAILDETDSGLDVNSRGIVCKAINKFKNQDKIILVITHYEKFLEEIKPDKTFTMKEGKIVTKG